MIGQIIIEWDGVTGTVRIDEFLATILRVTDRTMSSVAGTRMAAELRFTRTITVDYDMGGAVRQLRMPIEVEVKDAPIRVITLKE